jgi:hypothetical protein
MPAHKAYLQADGGVMGIIHIAESFKYCRLVIWLGKLIGHILKLNALGKGCGRQTA